MTDSTAIITEPKPLGWLSVIEKMLDKGGNTELLTKVFEMQQAHEREQQRKEFVQAFAAFKSEAPSSVERTGKVGFESKGAKVGYEHVELDVACSALVPILAKHGLAHSWETQQADGGLITVTCRLEHQGGHSKAVTLRAMPDGSGAKNAIQAVGSAITYLERYTFMAVCGMAQRGADDDATKAATDAELTDEQWQTINGLAEAIGLFSKENAAWLAKWLKWAELEKLSDLRASKYEKFLAALRAEKAKREKTAK
jgi:hypothetical protein